MLPRSRNFVYGSLLDDLLRQSGDIGIYAIQGDATEPGVPSEPVTDSPLSG